MQLAHRIRRANLPSLQPGTASVHHALVDSRAVHDRQTAFEDRVKETPGSGARGETGTLADQRGRHLLANLGALGTLFIDKYNQFV